MKKNNIILGVLLVGLLFSLGSLKTFATSVDQMSLMNIKSHPGKTTKLEITLEGTDSERSGYWYNHYKKIEGDSERMDITSWITISPKDYTIKKGEKKVFTIKIKTPSKAELGLWGASSIEAGKEGHSSERRTYIVFKDAPSGGNVYSGLLIPISVNVVSSPSMFALIMNFILKNIIVLILSIVVIILSSRLLLKKEKIENVEKK